VVAVAVFLPLIIAQNDVLSGNHLDDDTSSHVSIFQIDDVHPLLSGSQSGMSGEEKKDGSEYGHPRVSRSGSRCKASNSSCKHESWQSVEEDGGVTPRRCSG
jgi:hypothetical protein